MNDPASLQALLQPLFPGLLGMELTSTEPDLVRAKLKVRADLCTVGGVLHGGAVMAFADTLGAVATIVNLPQGARTTTIESKTNFFAAAAVDTLVTAECTPFHKGKSTMVWQTQIRNEAGKLCAVVTQTQMVLAA
ncbi:MAG: PaaI family thioesterase [Burkholderiaceae bacterium]|nr:PaaI family thioesterase [Burkholderiaceae bacterium]